MGIKLPYRQVFFGLIPFTTLITSHDTCRNAHRSGHKHQRPCIMSAEPLAGIKQKGINIISPQLWRIQGVVVVLLIKVPQHSLNKCSGTLSLCELLSRPAPCARIGIRWQCQIVSTLKLVQ